MRTGIWRRYMEGETAWQHKAQRGVLVDAVGEREALEPDVHVLKEDL